MYISASEISVQLTIVPLHQLHLHQLHRMLNISELL